MSDGPSDANREQDDARRVEMSASALADVLDDVRDRAFGLSRYFIDIANHELKRAGVKLAPSPAREPKGGR